MNKLVYLCLIALLSVSYVSCDDLCTTFKSQNDCQNNFCDWRQLAEQSCQQSFNCGTKTTDDQCYANKQFCQWNKNQSAICSVKADYCQLNDKNVCADADNCILVQPQEETCTVRGQGFGCSSFADEKTCTAEKECTYVPSYCSVKENVCSTLGQDACTAANHCSYNVQSCKLQTNARAQCAQQATQQPCEALGCVYNATDSSCSAPTQCTVTNNQCSALCEPNTATCSTIANTCSIADQAGCQNVANCEWIEKGACQDNAAYCKVGSCDAAFCVSTPKTDLKCVANTVKNTCSANTTQDTCKAPTCSFQAAIPANCSNIQQKCLQFPFNNQCNQQTGCTWGYEHGCFTTPSSGLINQFAVFVALIAALLI